VTDPPAPLDPPVAPGVPPAAGPGAGGPAIDVSGLSFRYASDAAWVLRDLELHVPGGGRIAITGRSGCGKSTLLALLLRFWDYESGSIRVGHRELRDMAQERVRELFSVVPQEVHLFHATIRDNLAVADAEATTEDMLAACALAQLDGLLARLPDGLDTVVGEDGVLLSGGERRRLAIARASLKDAPIVLLDEVTADLDPGTESALWASLDPWLAGRTVILVSHRPIHAVRVDAILELGAADPS
jgi:ABC-type multidrug transport system fused ATPase/permease subunit